MSINTTFTKENLDYYLSKLAKEYRNIKQLHEKKKNS